MAELNRIDMAIIDALHESPGHRNTRHNIAYRLDDWDFGDDDLDREENVSKLTDRVGVRLHNRLLPDGYLERIGPSERSGLYQLTPSGEDVADAIEEHGYDSREERLRVRLALEGGDD